MQRRILGKSVKKYLFLLLLKNADVNIFIPGSRLGNRQISLWIPTALTKIYLFPYGPNFAKRPL